MINILFVCMGNTCRSVLCEYLLKHMVNEKNMTNKFNIQSCGINAGYKNHAAENVIKIIEPLDIQIHNHISRQLTDDIIILFDYIFTVDTFILNYIKQNFHNKPKRKISCLNSIDIPDPYGLPLIVYQQCAKNINQSLKNILDEIIKNENL